MSTNVTTGIFATLKAKPGKEAEVETFLKSALPLANQEQATTVWFALKLNASTFGIFDAFADDSGRQAHLSGPIAAALMSKWEELLSEPPKIELIDVIAAKLNS
jgi:quinol monooxygenase YgiN